jgi:molybdopterin-guanine dinucleotide biosynthesis protein A
MRPLHGFLAVNRHPGRAVTVAPYDMPSLAEVAIDRLAMREMT